MSRSGYGDDCEHLELYRGTVARALKGKRGQSFLRELVAALDAMPEKTLIAGQLVAESGACCAIGAVCKARQLDVSDVDYFDPDAVARAIGVSGAMAAEIEYMNDEGNRNETPAQRWERMRKWASDNIAAQTPSAGRSDPATS